MEKLGQLFLPGSINLWNVSLLFWLIIFQPVK
jgi:hypothetical protein